MTLGSDSYVQPYTRPSIQVEDCDDATYLNPEAVQDAARSRTPFYASSSSSSTELNSQRANRPPSRSLLYSAMANQSTASVCSTASATPIPSRAASPLYTQDDDASSCSSDGEENELESSLLGDGHRRSYSLQEAPRWWKDRSLRRRRRGPWWYREMKRVFCPFVPKTPLTIVRSRFCYLFWWNHLTVVPPTELAFHPPTLHRVWHLIDLFDNIPLQPG